MRQHTDACAPPAFRQSAADIRDAWRAGRWEALEIAIRDVCATTLLRHFPDDDDLREEGVQHTLVRCWELEPARIDRIDNVVGFLKSIAQNFARDVLKHPRQRRTVRGAVGLRIVTRSVDPDSEDNHVLRSMILSERAMTIREAIRQLPVHTQRPLVLHYFHDRSVHALAVQFGISEGAVKMRLVRGRHCLEKLLRQTDVRPARQVA